MRGSEMNLGNRERADNIAPSSASDISHVSEKWDRGKGAPAVCVVGLETVNDSKGGRGNYERMLKNKTSKRKMRNIF